MLGKPRSCAGSILAHSSVGATSTSDLPQPYSSWASQCYQFTAVVHFSADFSLLCLITNTQGFQAPLPAKSGGWTHLGRMIRGSSVGQLGEALSAAGKVSLVSCTFV